MNEFPTDIQCFAQRLLNPFRGVMHTLRYRSAEAVTLDAVHWDLYVANDELTRGMEPGRRVQISDIRYGSWSQERGLKRGPIYPSEDFKRMEIQGAVVFEALRSMHGEVPFPLTDCYEYWLLDMQRKPLALLASATCESDISDDPPIDWRAGNAARERFASAATESPREAAHVLTRRVNALAGDPPSAQWFRRDADGSGVGLTGVHLDGSLRGRRLDAAAFPRFFLVEEDRDPYRRLVRDYLAWQSPWFLLLPLDQDTRRTMEGRARAQALEVERQHRLYPAILDASQINAALVEAMILRHQGTARSGAEVLPPDYIELNPTGGNYN